MSQMTLGLHGVEIPRADIVSFCERNHIRKLSLFGSILTDRFGPDSDVDLLVEFEPGAAITLLDVARMEQEFSQVVGRKVDVRTPEDLSRYFRERVVSEALVQYERE